MPESAVEAAASLREELLAILRQLNRADMEEPEGEGLEVPELLHLLHRQAYSQLSLADVEAAVAVLVGNRLAQVRDDTPYAWDRGRVLGPRVEITTEGKSFLVREAERSNRVE